MVTKIITSIEDSKIFKDNSICKKCDREKKLITYPYCWYCKYLGINNKDTNLTSFSLKKELS
jgi:hypothetical protein